MSRPAAGVLDRGTRRLLPPEGGSPGVCPRTRGSCPTIPVSRRRAAGGRGPPAYGSRTVRPQARRSCASDSTPGAGYRRVPGPAGGLERGRRLTGRGESPAPADRVVSLSPSCRAAAGTVSRATVSDSTPTAGGEDGGQVRRPEKSPPGLDRRAARATRPRRLRRPPCCDGRRAVRPAQRNRPVNPRRRRFRPTRSRSPSPSPVTGFEFEVGGLAGVRLRSRDGLGRTHQSSVVKGAGRLRPWRASAGKGRSVHPRGSVDAS